MRRLNVQRRNLAAEIGVQFRGHCTVGSREMVLQDACDRLSAPRPISPVGGRPSHLTRLFVNTQRWYPRDRTPSRYLSHVIRELLQPSEALFLLFQIQNDTQMLWHLAQPLYVLPNELGCPVVIIERGKDTVEGNMEGLA